MLDTNGTLQDQLRDESCDLIELQSYFSDGMIAFAVFMIGAGGLAGVGAQYGWWWMFAPASVALVLLASGFLDARKNWMRTLEQARDGRKARQERAFDANEFMAGD